MECNKDEAIKAKALAVRKMLEKDFVGAKRLITKAQQLFKDADNNISQMLTVCDVHCAAEMKDFGDTDCYGILQVPLTADDTLIKKQYRKLCLLLHPDKNKFPGAEAAFKLVGEANMILADCSKRSVYDMKRNASVRVGARRTPYQQPKRAPHVNTTPVNLHNMHQQQKRQPSNPSGLQAFWTMCPGCGTSFQYPISVLNRNIRCTNCMVPFTAHQRAVPSGANQRSAGVWKNSGAPHNVPGWQAKATGQQAQNSANPWVDANFGSHNASAAGGLNDKMKSKATGNTSKSSSAAGLKRRRTAVNESSESSDSETTTDSEEEIIEDGPAANSAGPGQHCRRSSRQKQDVKYNERSDDENIECDSNGDDENIDSDGNGDDENIDCDSNGDDEIVNSANLKRLKKGGLFHGDGSNGTKLNEDTAAHNGPANGANHCSNTEDKNKGTFHCSVQIKRESMYAGGNNDEKEFSFHSASNNGGDLNSHGASEEAEISCVSSEFFDFEQHRDVNHFKANQIWALYDDHGCMPRYYARITRVKTAPEFMVHFIWLEFDPTNEAETAWSSEGLPVACGHFKQGKSDVAKGTSMFSRTISCEKSKTRNSYEIYPRTGEIWALFKGWDIGWSSDADNHQNYEYEVVQVLSDLTTCTSIIAMPLVKIEGFISLFMQSKVANPLVIPQDDTLRFSHCVPHHLMRGTEKEGIPDGAIELDPAALPVNLGEAFASVVPESTSVKGQEFGANYAGSSSEHNCHKGFMGVGEGQRATCENAGISMTKPKEDNSEHNTQSAVEGRDVDEERDGENAGISMTTPKEGNSEHNTQSGVEGRDVDEEPDGGSQQKMFYPDPEFFDFSEIRLLSKFKPQQIWSLYSDVDKFPNYYAFIKDVDVEGNKVHARWLEVCPRGEEVRRLMDEGLTVACGTFRLFTNQGIETFTGTEFFSHPVHAKSTGKRNEYEIIPRLGEVWAVYKNWRIGWTTQDFKKCDYELVEILGHTVSSIQVQHLRKVDGYRAVFMPDRREGAVEAIRKDEYPKFSHQIPCFRLTHERGGKLQGFWELDPLSVPEEFLFTDPM